MASFSSGGWGPPKRSWDPLARLEDLTDPGAVRIIAGQLNDKALNQNVAMGAPQFEDLSECVQDIIIDTVAQGASTLEIHVLDPYWQLITRHGDQPAFIDVDDAGLLIPVDVNFPPDTDRWWRLAQANLTVDPTQPHVLVFEDRIVSLLRDQGGPKHAGNNQTRAQFIYACVRSVPQIRFVCPALMAKAGTVGGDVTQGQIDTTGIMPSSSPPVARSALNKDAPVARRNPAKRPGISRSQRKDGAVWTSGGWRYTKPIDGKSPQLLRVLNPPTNTRDDQLIPQKRP